MIANTTVQTPRPTARRAVSAAPGGRFDALVTALSGWMVAGVFLDGWAHIHVPALESFFTPWHGVLYSGFLVTAAALAFDALRRRRARAGYGLSIVGVAVFLVGGIADMAWHLVFGIEVSVEALLSPTHLLLATGFMLMISGPIRAAWQRDQGPARRGWRALGPALIAAALAYSILTFFTSYAHPFVDSYAATAYRGGDLYSPLQRTLGPPDPLLPQALGLAGILLQSALLAAVLSVLARRWRLPFGTVTLLLGLDAGLLSVIHDQYRLIPAALLAGLVGDVLSRWSIRWPRTWSIRVVGAGTPAALYALYFLTLAATGGIWWSVHLWTGAAVLAGLVGLGVAVLATPANEVST